MPSITVETRIQAPLDRVYSLAKEVERFPEFMPDLQSVEILSEEGSRRVSRWVGIVRPIGRKIEWTEEDEWDDQAHVCRFRQVEGDYDRYEGTWTFEACPVFDPEAEPQAQTRRELVEGEDTAGTMVKLAISAEIVVPLIGPLLRDLIAKLIEANARSMLEALAKRAEERVQSSEF